MQFKKYFGVHKMWTLKKTLGNYIEKSPLSYIGVTLDRISLEYFLSTYLYESPKGFPR